MYRGLELGGLAARGRLYGELLNSLAQVLIGTGVLRPLMAPSLRQRVVGLHTHVHTDRETYKHTVTKTLRHATPHTGPHPRPHSHILIHTHTFTHTNTHTHIRTHLRKHRHTHTSTDTHTRAQTCIYKNNTNTHHGGHTHAIYHMPNICGQTSSTRIDAHTTLMHAERMVVKVFACLDTRKQKPHTYEYLYDQSAHATYYTHSTTRKHSYTNTHMQETCTRRQKALEPTLARGPITRRSLSIAFAVENPRHGRRQKNTPFLYRVVHISCMPSAMLGIKNLIDSAVVVNTEMH